MKWKMNKIKEAVQFSVYGKQEHVVYLFVGNVLSLHSDNVSTYLQ